jgi:hypothetical protein
MAHRALTAPELLIIFWIWSGICSPSLPYHITSPVQKISGPRCSSPICLNGPC